MHRLLLDEGVSPSAAEALAALGLPVFAVGGAEAPALESTDDENCAWCADCGAVLVTHDRGRKDKAIHVAIRRHGVGVIFVHNDLRGPAKHLVRALLSAEVAIDDLANRPAPMNHRLRPNGKVERRG
jgi:hypothetical protein